MDNKEKAQKTYEILKRRKQLREYKRRKFLVDLADVQVRGFERCANGRWRMHQK